MAKMKREGKIDFSGWDFGFGTLDELIAHSVKDAVNDILKADPPIAFFSSGDDDDPTTIAVSMPLGEEVFFKFSIVDLIDDFINARTFDEKISAIEYPDIDNLVAALRFAADRLEAAKGQEPLTNSE